jgi:hypothetical protein
MSERVTIINRSQDGVKHYEQFESIPDVGDKLRLYGCVFVVESVNTVFKRPSPGKTVTEQTEVTVKYRH